MISERAKKIGESITLAITANAKKMKKNGEDVVIMASGEPDFDTPEHIKNAGIEAIKSGFTKYTTTSGIDELKQAICEKYRRDLNLVYEPSQVIVTVGGKQALFNLFLSIINPGDEVIVFRPYWVSYLEQIGFAGGVPVLAELSECVENPELLKKYITSKTKAILFNFPSNPSGYVISEDILEKFTDIAISNDLYIVSDEVYEKFIYDGLTFKSPASFSEKSKEKTIIINALSKTYSMTGWRVGYALGAKDVIKAMGAIQGHQTSNVCSIAQKAGVVALTSSQDCVKNMVEEFAKRRAYMFERLSAIDKIKIDKPMGAFYMFPDVSAFYGGKVKNSFDFCSCLLNEEKVAIIPGIGFGADNHVRLTYSASMEDIKKGMDRFEHFCKNL